jgi:hypothetical protein
MTNRPGTTLESGPHPASPAFHSRRRSRAANSGTEEEKAGEPLPAQNWQIFVSRRDCHAVRRARERVRGLGVKSASARSLIDASARSAARAATSSPAARAALRAMTAAVCSCRRVRVSASRRERPSRWLDCARCDAEQKRVSLLLASKCAPQKWHVVEWVAIWTPIRKVRVGVKKGVSARRTP